MTGRRIGVFDTFPWPQTPTKGQIAEVAAAAVALRGLRREIMANLRYSLRTLYRSLEEPRRQHPLMVDDKLRILTARGDRVTAVFPRQDRFTHAPKVLASNPPAGVPIERIGDPLFDELPNLLAPL